MAEMYTEEQVQQILHRALARKASHGQSLSREQVREIATDLGVSEEDFDSAEQEWLIQGKDDQEKTSFDRYKKNQFRDNVIKCLIVNTFLITINLFISGQVSWAVYPLLGWGLAVVLDGWVTYQPDSEQYAKLFEKWQYKQKRAQLTTQITNKVTSTVEEWLKPNS